MSPLRALFGHRVRYRIQPAGILYLCLIALVGSGGFLTGNNLLFLIFSGMLALLLVSGFLGRLVLAGLTLELLLPRHIAARAATDARVRLRNVKRLTPSFAIKLEGGHFLPEPVYFPMIPGGSEIEASVRVTFPRRGRHRENLFVLSTRFPFGFLHREAPLPIVRETLVYPAIEPSARTEAFLSQLEGEISTQQRGRGQDFYRIRPWETSDGTRMVDWKSSARTGQLQSREFAREEHVTVSVVLDRSIPRGADARFEALVDECAYLVWTLNDGSMPFEFRCDEFAESDVHAALRYLALVEPIVTPERPRLPERPDSSACAHLSAWG